MLTLETAQGITLPLSWIGVSDFDGSLRFETTAPDMAELYRAWISREYLDYSHEQLGAEGEQRLKDCLKEILER